MSSPTNGDFEQGDTGWNKGTGWSITNTGTPPRSGSYSAKYSATGTASITSTLVSITPGTSLSVSAWINSTSFSDSAGAVGIQWFNSSMASISFTTGNLINSNTGSWQLSSLTQTAPAGTAYAAVFISAHCGSGGITVSTDDVTWNYVNDRAASLTSPANGDTFTFGDSVLLGVTLTGTAPAVTQVVYKEGSTVLATSTTPNYSFNITSLAVGTHAIHAEVTLADASVLTTNTNTITVSAIVPVTTPREYKASNAYTYLVNTNFAGISAAIPSTAKVTAVKVVIDYVIRALIRSKDIGITDPVGSNPNVAFDITDGANFEASLFSQSGTNYTLLGAPIVEHVTMDRPDFTIIEQSTSDGLKWSVLDGPASTVTLGSDTELFGLSPIVTSDFIGNSLGLRFLPNLLPKPAYADTGDCCFRVFINKVRLQVYFNAGSVEYYFASPDKSQVLKGDLIASYVANGNFTTGDASGFLQLEPTLTIMDGTTTWIGADWTIHASYPPTDANQIALDAERNLSGTDGVGMSYNGLPSYNAVTQNRSRYVFIKSNFYATVGLDSIYGAHGLPRAFAYNGTDFYKIFTQADATKDSPRCIADHQGHLALGFQEGRVDISASGQPYNFDGVLGASEWAIGDTITGLQPLSGSLLGVFAASSIWGISGSNIDNFTTQVIVPRTGAIEYTLTSMGNIIYANSYGLYTLEQTEQYGDYVGNPLSQDVSTWLRPRLIRKATSNKEVITCWPSRTKNQYRLGFSDGYILTMTLNYPKDYTLGITYARQQIFPTFSKQKYFYNDGNTYDTLYDYPDIVLAAVSSELDITGEERIHIANIQPVTQNEGGFDVATNPLRRTFPTYVYETDKGWSFDGSYIPHFVELNWYFGESPVEMAGIQKIRIHGLTKGNVGLQVSVNGMQSDRQFYLSDYSTPALIPVPPVFMFINPNFVPTTNYTDIESRGISIQMKFEGSNIDITLPEPVHVIQALAVQSTPSGTGNRAS